jgi:hypothetical protein
MNLMRMAEHTEGLYWHRHPIHSRVVGTLIEQMGISKDKALQVVFSLDQWYNELPEDQRTFEAFLNRAIEMCRG